MPTFKLCEAYHQTNDNPHLSRCRKHARFSLTIQTPVDIYDTRRCQPCRDELAAKVAAGDPIEVLYESPFSNQHSQLATQAPHLLAEIEAGNLTLTEAMVKLAQEKLDWPEEPLAPPDPLLKFSLAKLKTQFDDDDDDPPPTTPAPLVVAQPLPRITLSPTTLQYVAPKQTEWLTEQPQREAAYKAALRPDPLNRGAGFKRNLNNPNRHG